MSTLHELESKNIILQHPVGLTGLGRSWVQGDEVRVGVGAWVGVELSLGLE